MACAVSYNSLKVDSQVMVDQPKTETVLALIRDATVICFLTRNLEVESVMVITFIEKPNESNSYHCNNV